MNTWGTAQHDLLHEATRGRGDALRGVAGAERVVAGVLQRHDQRRLLREHEVPVQGARGAEGERPRERVRVAERLEERTWVAKKDLS